MLRAAALAALSVLAAFAVACGGSAAPGLGVTLDEEIVSHYRVA